MNRKIKKQFNINLTMIGNISSEFDFQSLDKLKVDGVIIGKALYKNKLNPNTILKNIKVN